jgi:hypothetical protein
MIIDVDTHWELALYPKGEHPFEPWRLELPRELEQRGVSVALQWDEIDYLVTELEPNNDRLAPYRELAQLL